MRSYTRSVAFLAVLMLPTFTAAAPLPHDDSGHERHEAARSPFVDAVRRATERFLDVRNAGPDYVPVLGCVSGPLEGAMGVHFLNQALVDDEVRADSPEALIYEFRNGTARLVGVEYIVPAAAWHATHAPEDVPVLEGQLLQFVDSPNRFGLPAHYELHVWAWRENPNGAFVDWHPRVSCEGRQ